MEAHKQTLHFFIISDSIGETALNVAKAIVSQFPYVHTVLHKFTFISTITRLTSILDQAKDLQAIVLMTLSNYAQATEAEQYCQKYQLHYFNLTQPFTQLITKLTGHEPIQVAGAQHELSDEYFNRINAMEFAMRYDDGKDPKIFLQADIVLLGISRTSKTPLSMYLATMGYRVANLPLIPENKIPDIIFQVDPKKIVGLTNDMNVIQKFRRKRMAEFGLPQTSAYASHDRIQEELEFANRLYHQLQCPIINVADRSIEETAHIIVEVLNFPNTSENLNSKNN